MRKILITGGAGFIGTELVKQLGKNAENEITVLDVMTRQIHGEDWKTSYLYNAIKDSCRFIKGDVRDLGIVERAVGENEYIIHLAAETGTGQSMYMINHYDEVNIMGTSNILQAVSNMGSKSRVRKIILSSSRSVYGEGRYRCMECGIVYPAPRSKEVMQSGDFNMYCGRCGRKLMLERTTEDSDVKPASLYAFTKYTQEKMLETMCPALGIAYTVFRFQNVYGIGQSLKNPYTGILSIFSALMLEDKPVNIFEDGLESRDFINVVDVVRTVIRSMDEPKSNSEIINLGSGVGTSVIEIAEFLKKAYGSKSTINITGDFRIGDIAHNVADISKARELLGFEQSIPLEQGLKEFCDWVRVQSIDNSGYEKSLAEMEETGMFVRK